MRIWAYIISRTRGVSWKNVLTDNKDLTGNDRLWDKDNLIFYFFAIL